MEQEIQTFKEIEDIIILLRGKQVIIDSQVAQIYGVQTMRVNEAVANNPEKFPRGYVFELTKEEKSEVIENFDNLKQLKFSPTMPKAFTEKGLYMLATILKSERAIQTTISIVETFAKLRELSRTISSITSTADEATQKSLMQKGGEIFADLLDNNIDVTGSETSIELNLAVLKVKHTVKRKR